MTAPNRTKGEVDLSEAGDGVFIQFNMDGLERLHAKYGDDYFKIICEGLNRHNPAIIKTCVEIAAPKADIKELPFGLPFEKLEGRIYDALFLCVHNRTLEEQLKFDREETQRRLKEAEGDQDPRMAVLAAISQMFGGQDTGQA